MNKATHCSALWRSRNAPHIRIPIFFAHSAQKISLCSCVGARKMSANARASSAFASAFLAALFLLLLCFKEICSASNPLLLSFCLSVFPPFCRRPGFSRFSQAAPVFLPVSRGRSGRSLFPRYRKTFLRSASEPPGNSSFALVKMRPAETDGSSL